MLSAVRGLRPLLRAAPRAGPRIGVRYNSTEATPATGRGRAWVSASGAAALIAVLLYTTSGRNTAPAEREREPPVAAHPTQASSEKGGNQSDLPEIAHLDRTVVDDTSAPMRVRMETYVKLLQHEIVSALSKEEPAARFLIDSWLRKQGGEGISCVLQDGTTFEKAGVNISIVHGTLPPSAVKQMSADHAGLMHRTGYKLDGEQPDVSGLPFYAAGLSLVVHPKNPFAPTVHFNYRYFELTHPEKLADGSANPRHPKHRTDGTHDNEPVAWWFGGGTDLTPIYLFDDDATHFHQTLKNAADEHDPAFYPTWKKWCDTYFLIPHRGEARGIGGIFFDDLTLPQWAATKAYVPLTDGSKPSAAHPVPHTISSARQHDKNSLFATVRAMGDSFLPAYLPLLQKRKAAPYTAAHERWQQIRRGRYVEFNLVYDRGTKFGLYTPGARIESILMSLPLKARWEYMEKSSGGGAQGRDGKATTQADEDDEHAADEDVQAERRTQAVLRTPRDWAS